MFDTEHSVLSALAHAHSRRLHRPVTGSVAVLAAGLFGLAYEGCAAAFEFSVGDLKGTLTTRLTAGAGWRVENQDDALLGKLNVKGQETLCQPDDCLSLSGDPGPNQRLVNARGGFLLHASDDGDMNYDRGDLFSALAKLNSTASAKWDDFTFKVSYVAFYDAVNTDFRETHNNTLLQPHHTPRSHRLEQRVGWRSEFREAFVQYSTTLSDHAVTLAVGAQRVRWGEANLHPLNTLDVINPQDAILPRQPGLSFNELYVPTDLVLATFDLFDGVSAEVFYQYDWDAARPEPQGTYFASSDAIAGEYINITPGQYAEDPRGSYRAQPPVSLLTSSTRIAQLRETSARNDGQFGVRINWYAADLNDGTEFGFYFANYHSRLPYFSVIESQRSCTRRAAVPGNFLAAALACTNATGVFNGSLQLRPSLETEPLPFQTEAGLLEYPEDIRMVGVSFNTTAFGLSVSGEYSYRPNLPVQVLAIDVLYAGGQQAFPTQDIPILASELPGLAGTTIPGAPEFIPSFIAEHRGRTLANHDEYQPSEHVRGWERLGVGQFALNALKVLPSILGADEATVLGEAGFTHVVDMPKDVYFQGQAEGPHPGPGADGTGPPPHTTLRLNPTQSKGGWADDFAWGLRGLGQMTYNSVMGTKLTLRPTLLWFEDIQGTAASPMQNYVEGNRWITVGTLLQWGQNLEGSLVYMYFDGSHNVLQDRDNVQVSVSYTF